MFFHFFKSLIFQVVMGVKGQKKSPKWQKILSIKLHISETTHNMIFRYGTHVQSDNISRHFFLFFKILIFWVHREVKGQKTFQNDKNFCLLCSISQEPCIIWLSFMVHVYKDNISRYFVQCFKSLIFQVARGWKGKN